MLYKRRKYSYHGGGSLAEASLHYATFLKAEQARASAITVKAAIGNYLAAKKQEQIRGELSPLTLSELKSKLGIIETAFADRRLIDIDQAAVQTFLDGLHHRPRGRANLRTKLSQLLNHSRRRGWIVANPVEMTSVRVPPRDVAILTIAETTKVLRTAEKNLSLLPYVALSLYAGLRLGEAQQLLWTDVHFEAGQVEIRPEITKTRQRRFVPLEPICAQWLLPYRLASGKVAPANFNKLWKELRAKAGMSKLSGQRSWQDLLRHTHASYWLALHGDRPRLAENLGNSVEVIRNFYRRAIPCKEAESFWEIRPQMVEKANVVVFVGM